MVAMKRILVPTDFSQAANLAVTYGRELSQKFGASLCLLHVVNDVARRRSDLGANRSLGRAQTALESLAFEELNASLTDEDHRLGGEAVVFTAAHPSQAIVEFAGSIQADVIVMGAPTRTAVARLFLGATTERVVRTAPCPVLTVRRPEHAASSRSARREDNGEQHAGNET
jgi:universal stress protein A